MEERNPHLFPFPSARPEMKVYPIIPGATLYPVNHEITREALERLQDPEHSTSHFDTVRIYFEQNPSVKDFFATTGHFFQALDDRLKYSDYIHGVSTALWIFMTQAERQNGSLYITQELPEVFSDPWGRTYMGHIWINRNFQSYRSSLRGIASPLHTWIRNMDIDEEEKPWKEKSISLGLSDADLVVSNSGLIVPRQRHITGQEID